MFNISKYLDKIRENLKSQIIEKDYILDVIKQKAGVDIGLDDFDVSNGILYIKSSPGIKNKIFIYKKSILLELNEVGQSIKDIR